MMTRFKRCTAWISLTALLLCGCQNGKDSPVIVRRKTETEAAPVKAEEGMTIAEQVQIPKKYQMKLQGNGVLKVEADADIIIPDTQGFKLKKVEGRVFTQADVDKQVEVLLNGAELTQRVYKEDDPGQGYTKEALVVIKELDAAPETPETEVVEPVIGHDPDYNGEADINALNGTAEVDGLTYDYMVTNYWSNDSKWIISDLLRTDIAYSFTSLYGRERKELPANVDEFREKADKLVQDLGFTDMAVYGGEYFESILRDSGEPIEAYGFHYTRVVDDIPITYTMETGSVSPQLSDVEMAQKETTAYSDGSDLDYLPAWPYERLTVIYDNKGLAYFDWENPYEISDISDDYVFLLPFSDIKTIFEQVILTENDGYVGEYYDHAQYHIYEVRLGYARVMEKGNPGTGTLVPVWDFFGTRTTTYHSYEEGGDPVTYVESVQYESLMTINAMDGSIIDRSYGY